MVRLLLAHGAEVALQDKEGKSALRHALQEANKNILGQLLSHGADPNLRNTNGVTPLEYARRRRRFDLVELMRRGAQ